MKNRGFTLTELMITVAIIGILASIAIPIYRGYVTKARRSDAMTALQTVALYEEKCFTEKGSYNSIEYLIDNFGLIDPDNDNVYEPSDYYDISVLQQDATTYIIRAVPKGSQSGDITLAINSDTRLGRLDGGNFVEDRALWRR